MLPKLPTQFFSHHGPLPVVQLAADAEGRDNLCGRFLYTKRRIEISEDMDRRVEWMTLWHEAIHVALIDGGGSNGMSKEQNEAVCDALGSYLTAMMQAGWLKIAIPHSPATGATKTQKK